MIRTLTTYATAFVAALVLLTLQGCAPLSLADREYIAKRNADGCRPRGYSLMGADVWCAPKGGLGIEAPDTASLPLFRSSVREQ